MPVTTSRTFIVRVSAAPPRVVVEDVRERHTAVVGDLPAIVPQIEAWLAGTPVREDFVSPTPYGQDDELKP